jgi:hypothetical protein
LQPWSKQPTSLGDKDASGRSTKAGPSKKFVVSQKRCLSFSEYCRSKLARERKGQKEAQILQLQNWNTILLIKENIHGVNNMNIQLKLIQKCRKELAWTIFISPLPKKCSAYSIRSKQMHSGKGQIAWSFKNNWNHVERNKPELLSQWTCHSLYTADVLSLLHYEHMTISS